MSLVIVHLSDIHIKTEKDKILFKAEKISEKIQVHQGVNKHCFILISGDIAFSGCQKEYDYAFELFSTIKKLLTNFFSSVNFIIAPGNHDCNFKLECSVRKSLIGSIVNGTTSNIDDDIIDHCTKIQSDFYKFRDKLQSENICKNDKLWTKYVFQINNKSISFDCLNFAWCSQLQEGQGDLFYPIENYENELNSENDLKIFVLHHPLNWIKQGNYQELRSKIRAHSDIVFSGHEHHGTVTEISDKSDGDSLILEGYCLQENGLSDHSQFSIFTLDLIDNKSYHEILSYDNSNYEVLEKKYDVLSFKDTPNKIRNGLSISDNHMSWLIDPGASFSHPNKQKIYLSDIYVYPDIEKFTSLENDWNQMSSSSLIEDIETQEEVIIKGEVKNGKTSLLKTLNNRFFDLGYAPLFIDCTKITRTSDSDLEKFFHKNIERQYGEDSISNYLATPREKKIILIDSFDKSKVSDRFQWKILCYFRSKAKKIIATADESMDFSELISSEVSIELSHFKHYKLKHFGNKLRYDLIKKWSRIGEDYNLSSAGLLGKVDQTEKILNSVIGKNLVPRVPFYILTILQSLEAGNTNSDFHNAGLGYYYQYLITQTLGRASVSADKLDEIFNFLSQLSWFIYNENVSDLKINILDRFIDNYSKEYTRVNNQRRIETLLESRILSKKGNYYSFAYPYIYYFFLGKYLSQNINSNDEVKRIVSNSCRHIYIHENANIVMFLTHHSKDQTIIDDILSNLRGLFDEHKPITFDRDTKFLEGFVSDTAEFVYKNISPDHVRSQKSIIQDEVERIEEGKEINEKEENELDLVSKLNKLIKTMEILGQLLKSYYGSIPNKIKVEIARDVFNAPLRAMKDFYCYIERDRAAFINEVEGLIKAKNNDLDKNQRNQIAERFAYQLIGMISSNLILKPAIAIASPHLDEVVSTIVSENPTTAFRLIKIASELELPDNINFDDIKSLYRDIKDDLLCQRVLQSIVLRHMYLFKVSEQDKQKLCAMISIGIDKHHKMEFKLRGKK